MTTRDGELVIDGDGHVMEPPDLWSTRMDEARWGDWTSAVAMMFPSHEPSQPPSKAPAELLSDQSFPAVQMDVFAATWGRHPSGGGRGHELPKAPDGDLVLVDSNGAHRRRRRLGGQARRYGVVASEKVAPFDLQARTAAQTIEPAVREAGARGGAARCGQLSSGFGRAIRPAVRRGRALRRAVQDGPSEVASPLESPALAPPSRASSSRCPRPPSAGSNRLHYRERRYRRATGFSLGGCGEDEQARRSGVIPDAPPSSRCRKVHPCP